MCHKKAFIRKIELIQAQMKSVKSSWVELTNKVKRFENEIRVLEFFSLKALIASPCIKWLIKRRLDDPEKFNAKVNNNIYTMIKVFESLCEFVKLKKTRQSDFFDQEAEEFFLILTNSVPLLFRFATQYFLKVSGIFYSFITAVTKTSSTNDEEESNLLDQLRRVVMQKNPAYICLKGFSGVLRLISKRENSLTRDFLFDRCGKEPSEDSLKEYPEVELGIYSCLDQLMDDLIAILHDFYELRQLLYEARTTEFSLLK